MSRAEPVLCEFRHIHVSELGDTFREEDIGGFDISMNYIMLMQIFQSDKYLIGDLPYLRLIKPSLG